MPAKGVSRDGPDDLPRAGHRPGTCPPTLLQPQAWRLIRELSISHPMDKKSIIPINLNNCLRPRDLYDPRRDKLHRQVHGKNPAEARPKYSASIGAEVTEDTRKTHKVRNDQCPKHHPSRHTTAERTEEKMAVVLSNMGPHAQISGAPMPLHPPDGASPVGHTRRASGPHGEQGNQWMRGRPETSRQISTQQWYRR